MKTKAVFMATVLLTMIFSCSFSFAQSQQITNGLNYLAATQNPDGSWTGMVNKGMLPTTITTIETLSLLGQENSQSYTNALIWLQSQSLDTTDYLSKRIHALAVAGNDLDLLLSYIDQLARAWGGYAGYAANNLDSVRALLALKQINYQDQNTINYVINNLLSAQNPDGGWGFCSSTSAGCSDSESNVYMTVLGLNTFSQFKTIYALNMPINNAVAYLLAKQNTDGGFGSSTGSESPSTVFETALTFEALITSGAVGAEYAANMQNALNYLYSTQLPNGSWNDDPYSTALALRVLYLYSNPPPPPTAGTITGKVRDASTNQLLAGVSAALQSDPTKTTLTDASGSFSLTNVPAGSQTIDFFLNGYGTASVTVNVTTGSIIDIGMIPLSASPTTGIIKGTVTDAANGQPLSGVTITVAGSFNGTATTGADGSFIFANVTPGAVTLSATKTGYNSVTGTGTVTAGGVLII